MSLNFRYQTGCSYFKAAPTTNTQQAKKLFDIQLWTPILFQKVFFYLFFIVNVLMDTQKSVCVFGFLRTYLTNLTKFCMPNDAASSKKSISCKKKKSRFFFFAVFHASEFCILRKDQFCGEINFAKKNRDFSPRFSCS